MDKITINRGERVVVESDLGKFIIYSRDGETSSLDSPSSSSSSQQQKEFNPVNEVKVKQENEFNALLEKFNAVLEVCGCNKIEEDSTTYKYLVNQFNNAYDEWNAGASSKFYDSTIYSEVTNYRGSNSSIQSTCYNALQSWLMAMCLSELVPTSGDSNFINNQTRLFKLAYELGGDDLPVYDNYTIKGDVYIARLVAGAVYAYSHDAYLNYFSDMRTELGGNAIDASDWEGLGYDNMAGSPDSKMTSLGYLVNAAKIFPGAAGPFADGYSKVYPVSQRKDQFYGENGDESSDEYEQEVSKPQPNWYPYNYKIDVNLDKFITDTYQQFTEEGDGYTFKTPTDKSSKEVLRRILESAAIYELTDYSFFGKKLIEFNKAVDLVYIDPNIGPRKITKLLFRQTETAETDTNQNFNINGPFSDLHDLMFENPHEYSYSDQTTTLYDETDLMKFFHKVLYIIGLSRYPLVQSVPGRRRPSGGTAYYDSARVPSKQEDPLNGIGIGSVSALFADTEAQVIEWSSQSIIFDFPHDSAISYVSEAAIQSWTMAMYLGQIKPTQLVTYLKNAYRFGVNTAIGRHCWNSDLMYGRLCATMTLPILNAMSGLLDDYNAAKEKINPKMEESDSEGLIIPSSYDYPYIPPIPEPEKMEYYIPTYKPSSSSSKSNSSKGNSSGSNDSSIPVAGTEGNDNGIVVLDASDVKDYVEDPSIDGVGFRLVNKTNVAVRWSGKAAIAITNGSGGDEDWVGNKFTKIYIHALDINDTTGGWPDFKYNRIIVQPNGEYKWIMPVIVDYKGNGDKDNPVVNKVTMPWDQYTTGQWKFMPTDPPQTRSVASKAGCSVAIAIYHYCTDGSNGTGINYIQPHTDILLKGRIYNLVVTNVEYTSKYYNASM